MWHILLSLCCINHRNIKQGRSHHHHLLFFPFFQNRHVERISFCVNAISVQVFLYSFCRLLLIKIKNLKINQKQKHKNIFFGKIFFYIIGPIFAQCQHITNLRKGLVKVCNTFSQKKLFWNLCYRLIFSWFELINLCHCHMSVFFLFNIVFLIVFLFKKKTQKKFSVSYFKLLHFTLFTSCIWKMRNIHIDGHFERTIMTLYQAIFFLTWKV